MESTGLYKDIQDNVAQTLRATNRSASELASEDLDFHRAANPSVGARIDEQNARLLQIANRIVAHSASSSGLVRPQLNDAEDVELNWTEIVDVLDSLLEKADTTLDEFSGVLKKSSPSNGQSPAPQSGIWPAYNTSQYRDMPKPQLQFDHPPDNEFKGSFRPLLTKKPHAIVSFEESMNPVFGREGSIYYPHPYETEIAQYQYPFSVFATSDPIPPLPFESTRATFVETPEALNEMLAELKGAKEIAIDVEHHDYRSYVGIASLMQISTRNKDWIIDTLQPWRRKLEILNEVFTDPQILKVLHGCQMDTIWLQRDFGLYLVGVFDTYHAAKVLQYPYKSLAFLLKKFVDFEAQKQYQKADWRIRPLPTELVDYARSDTHYLLYIYDRMKNEVVQQASSFPQSGNLINLVLERSKEWNLQQYENPGYDVAHGFGPIGWRTPLVKHTEHFSKEQFSVFRAVHQWRDELARKMDENLRYIMVLTHIFSVARLVPRDEASLTNALPMMSPPVQARKQQLLEVIKKAVIDGQNGPEMSEIFDREKAELEGLSRPPGAPIAQPPLIPGTTVQNIANSSSVGEGSQILRSSVSQFWGTAFKVLQQEQRRMLTTNSIHLALPLPKLTAQIFKDSTVDTKVDHSEAVADAHSPRSEERRSPIDTNKLSTNSETFTLRQSIGKRRRRSNYVSADPEHFDVGNVPGKAEIVKADTNGLFTDTTVQAGLKGWRHMQEKEQKLRLQERGLEIRRDDSADAGMQDEPFDYTTAPSVLRAPTGLRGGREKNRFNPYARASNAPKGLGRAPRGNAGRSRTFKR